MADAATEQLPKHLVRMPTEVRAHGIVAVCFVASEPRVYTIEHAVDENHQSWKRYARRVWKKAPSQRLLVPRIFHGGSGAAHLPGSQGWMRDLLRLAKAYEHKRLSADGVAECLAQINFNVSRKDALVGPNCIVVWSGAFAKGGGHIEFNGLKPAQTAMILPHIQRGGDVRAAIQRATSIVFDCFTAGGHGELARITKDELNHALERLPDKPDEKLR
jgi:hypothetical protein